MVVLQWFIYFFGKMLGDIGTSAGTDKTRLIILKVKLC